VLAPPWVDQSQYHLYVRGRLSIIASRSGDSVISTASSEPAVADRQQLAADFVTIREFTTELCAPLAAEDCVVQSMPDVSPTRWHLAHTTWFFETFVLARFSARYQTYDPGYDYLFNSYYNAVGEQFPRASRGLLSRPTVDEVLRYRAEIDERVLQLLEDDDRAAPALAEVVRLGLHHEQQHQELMLTDIKHVFSCNPLAPVYAERSSQQSSQHVSQQASQQVPQQALDTHLDWVEFDEGLDWIGHDGVGFAYDNEGPRHREFLESRQLATRLISNREYRTFIEDGGYRRPELWLSAGWLTAQQLGWQAPLYWQKTDAGWSEFTLNGSRPLVDDQPVCHVSFFEADAFARWAGARLSTEAEWEVAARSLPAEGNFVERRTFHPSSVETNKKAVGQAFGDLWEWTASPYVAYPGYCPPEGVIGEYNGKFMCNQFVLRGGSCATSQSHIRPTYRNFFPPEARWQFTGIRLAR
jgi:ergothioneine biosynthesis protein EgtB